MSGRWLWLPVAAALSVAGGDPAVVHGGDASAGIVVTSPRPGSFVRGPVRLAIAPDPTVDAVTFEVSRDLGVSWSAVATDTFPADGLAAVWESRPWSGDALLRAVTAVGPSAPIAVHVDNDAPRVALEQDRQFVSAALAPTGGRVRLRVRSDEPVALRLRVVRPGRFGIPVAAPAAPTRRFTVLWRPRSHGERLPDGDYLVVVQTRDRAGNATAVASRVVVDSRPPVLGRPEVDATRRRLLIRAAFADASGVASGVLDGRNVNTGDELHASRPAVVAGELVWRIPPDRGRRSGAYDVALTVQDRAGNLAEPPGSRVVVRHPGRAEVVARVLGAGPKVALTFDDCVWGSAWERILSTLTRRGVRAAFFCTGQNVRALSGLAARTVAAGHVVGSHAWGHAELTHLAPDDVAGRLARDEGVWWRAAHTSPLPYFRPPYGSYDRSTLSVAGAAGYSAIVLWDVDPQDWRRPGARSIASHVVSRSRAGSIVLLHVTPQTAAALPAIIGGLRRRGLQPVGLDELLWAPGATRTNAHWPRG